MEVTKQTLELVMLYLLSCKNYMWNPIVAKKPVFPLTKHKKVKALIYSFPMSYVLLYLNRKKSGKKVYTLDIYSKYPLEATRDFLLGKQKRKTKSKVVKAMNLDCAPLGGTELIRVFASVDIVAKMVEAGVDDIDFSMLKNENLQDVAFGICASFDHGELYYITNSMLDEDSTMGQIHAVLPMVSMDVAEGESNEILAMVYRILDTLWMNFSISSVVKWVDNMTKNEFNKSDEDDDEDEDDDDDDGGVAVADEGQDDDFVWQNPFDISKNGYDYGVGDDGRILFQMNQIKEVNHEILNCINYIPLADWFICNSKNPPYKELRGLDRSVLAAFGGAQHVVSRMNDGKTDFYYFSQFRDGKKIRGEIIRSDNYANYVILESLLGTIEFIHNILGDKEEDIEAPQDVETPKK